MACHTKITSLAFWYSQNPSLYSTYTIKSAAPYLSLKHHCRQHNRGTPLIARSTQNPMNKSIGARSLMQMVVLVLFLTISLAHAISHSRVLYDAHKMSFTQYNTGKLHIDFIYQQHRNAWSTFILDISKVLQDQASSVSMNQSAHIAGQSSVLYLRSNQISSVSAAHLMCRGNFLPRLKTQSKVLSIHIRCRWYP